jgi:hypothetical protein
VNGEEDEQGHDDRDDVRKPEGRKDRVAKGVTKIINVAYKNA